MGFKWTEERGSELFLCVFVETESTDPGFGKYQEIMNKCMSDMCLYQCIHVYCKSWRVAVIHKATYALT